MDTGIRKATSKCIAGGLALLRGATFKRLFLLRNGGSSLKCGKAKRFPCDSQSSASIRHKTMTEERMDKCFALREVLETNGFDSPHKI